MHVDHEPCRTAELEHAHARGRRQTDAVAHDPLEVADLRDFPNLGQVGFEVAGRTARDVAVPKHQADPGRALQRHRLAAGVADEMRGGLPVELVLRHRIGGGKPDDQPVIAVVVRHPDVVDGPGGAAGPSGFIGAGKRRQVLGRCLGDAGDGDGTGRKGDGGESEAEAMECEHYVPPKSPSGFERLAAVYPFRRRQWPLGVKPG